MEISKRRIEELIEIYKTQTGKDITYEEAEELAHRLLILFGPREDEPDYEKLERLRRRVARHRRKKRSEMMKRSTRLIRHHN